jgi:hypothetical protein
MSLILPAYTTDIVASEREALCLFLYLSFTLRSRLPLLSLLPTHLHRLSPFLLWCAFAHAQALEATTGIKDKVGAILRAALDLIDADQNGTITRDELKIYGAKVPSLSHARTHLRCRYLSAGISARVQSTTVRMFARLGGSSALVTMWERAGIKSETVYMYIGQGRKTKWVDRGDRVRENCSRTGRESVRTLIIVHRPVRLHECDGLRGHRRPVRMHALMRVGISCSSIRVQRLMHVVPTRSP